ncbi:MAG: MTH1187 family thiamine-binding protein [Halochromatium sp.]
MSVLADLSIFPINQGEHLSGYVASVVQLIADSGHPYQLTAMGTLFETDRLGDALSLIEQAHAILAAAGCQRIYATVKLDIREGPQGRLTQKTASVEARLPRP